MLIYAYVLCLLCDIILYLGYWIIIVGPLWLAGSIKLALSLQYSKLALT